MEASTAQSSSPADRRKAATRRRAQPQSAGTRARASTGPGQPRAPAASRGRVLVLNASYEPLNVCTVRRAVVLILKEKAELIERGERRLRSESCTFPQPVVIRLVTYVRVPRDNARRRITRRAVFARDSWTCQYCGATSHLTVDHMIPRSRGGPSELGQHRHLVCPVQPPQGQPHAGRDRDEAAQEAAGARADRVHPGGGAGRAERLAAVPAAGLSVALPLASDPFGS